jgi:hypothetical protein
VLSHESIDGFEWMADYTKPDRGQLVSVQRRSLPRDRVAGEKRQLFDFMTKLNCIEI